MGYGGGIYGGCANGRRRDNESPQEREQRTQDDIVIGVALFCFMMVPALLLLVILFCNLGSK